MKSLKTCREDLHKSVLSFLSNSDSFNFTKAEVSDMIKHIFIVIEKHDIQFITDLKVKLIKEQEACAGTLYFDDIDKILNSFYGAKIKVGQS